MNDTPTLTVEMTLQLAVKLLKDEDKEWWVARDIYAVLEMEQEKQAVPFQLPGTEEEFEALLEQDVRFVASGHGFALNRERLIAMNEDDWLSAESCRARARKHLDLFEQIVKTQERILEELTSLDLEQLTLMVMDARKTYPRGAKVTFDDDSGWTTNGVPTKATGTVTRDVMIFPDGRCKILLCCEFWKGIEILSVAVAESDIIDVVPRE